MSLAEFCSAAARRRYWAGSLRGWPRVRDAAPNPAPMRSPRSSGRATSCGSHAERRRPAPARRQPAGDRPARPPRRRRVPLVRRAAAARGRAGAALAWNPGFVAGTGGARPDGDTSVAEPVEEFRVPDCRECGGVLKPAVVFFGEGVPRLRVDECLAGLSAADALLVVGSSLMVYSGYRFVLAARDAGSPSWSSISAARGRTRSWRSRSPRTARASCLRSSPEAARLTRGGGRYTRFTLPFTAIRRTARSDAERGVRGTRTIGCCRLGVLRAGGWAPISRRASRGDDAAEARRTPSWASLRSRRLICGCRC